MFGGGHLIEGWAYTVRNKLGDVFFSHLAQFNLLDYFHCQPSYVERNIGQFRAAHFTSLYCPWNVVQYEYCIMSIIYFLTDGPSETQVKCGAFGTLY